MKSISLLDCTLRDGGYVNNWCFGHSVITGTYKRLEEAGVEYIEVGFLDDRVKFDINRSIIPDTNGVNKIFENVKKGNAVSVAMIDFGTCKIENIQDCQNSFIDGIRVIFKKEKITEALPFCEKIKEKGYRLFIQAISITAYSDQDIIKYVQQVNKIEPFAFSIVDTYGLLDERKLKHYFYIIDNNLNKNIKIGYHAHNNFQLAFSNSIKFLAMDTSREIIVDSTVYGMGKSAGNCPSELIGLHLNQHYDKNYDINQFLETFDTDLMGIYQHKYWGYKYNYFISAMQNCHPNYVQYLIDKKSLTVKGINDILSNIPNEKRLLYDNEYIERAYIEFQTKKIINNCDLSLIANQVRGRDIVLLGPGKSIINEEAIIVEHIKTFKSLVFAVNFIPDRIHADFIFVSNAKRYSKLTDVYEKEKLEDNLIITSNITSFDIKPHYTVSLDILINDNSKCNDNGLILCINLLKMLADVKKVNLAGFDGFTSEKDYYLHELAFAGNSEYLLKMNKVISEVLYSYKELSINFITNSLYKFRQEHDSQYIKAALFDLDGTLLDTSRGIYESIKYTLDSLNLTYDKKMDFSKFIGPPIQESFKKYLNMSNNEAEQAAVIFRDYYSGQALFMADPYDGIFELCHKLMEDNIILGIATNKRNDYAIRLLKHFGFDVYFKYIYGTDYKQTLNKIDLINKIVSDIGLPYDECIYIGDTLKDYECAVNMGMKFVGVSYGFGFNDDYKSSSYKIIERPLEIYNVIKGEQNSE